jgi:cysteinyl-tRNA synthetase
MSTKYLGEKFDIHGGGMDLKFPHHECEVAQGTGCNGVSPVNYWMHANMLTMNGQRMSKSTGNYILPMELISGKNDFFEKAFHPSIVRFNFLQAHYRSVLDISNEAMVASEKGFLRLMEAVKILNNIEASSSTSSFILNSWKEKCYAALTDDFNSPILISHLFEAVKFIFAQKEGKESISQQDLEELKNLINAFVYDVLGLQNIEENNNAKLDQTLQVLIELRNQARKAKNFELSDQIRDQLLEKGIELKDGREGTSYILV